MEHQDGAFDGKGGESDLITDHKFKPRGRWWDLCVHCNLAQAAHTEAETETEEEAAEKGVAFTYVMDEE